MEQLLTINILKINNSNNMLFYAGNMLITILPLKIKRHPT